MEGHKLIPAEEMAAKVRAAVRARIDPHPSPSHGRTSFRRKASMRRFTGATCIVKQVRTSLFIEAPTDVGDNRAYPEVDQRTDLVNLAPKTPYLHVTEYEKMGYAMGDYIRRSPSPARTLP